MQEIIDMREYLWIRKSPYLLENTDTVGESQVDSGLNDPSIIRSIAHVTCIDKGLDNFRFVKVFGLPAVTQLLTPKEYVDDAVEEITLVRTYPKSNFDNIELSNLSHTILFFDPNNNNHATKKNLCW